MYCSPRTFDQPRSILSGANEVDFLHFTTMFMNLLALLALQYSLPVYGVTSLNINTTLGLVYRLINGSSPDVAQTLGIPLAAAPVEDLRFAAPAAYEARGTIDATKQGPLCPQYLLAEGI